MPALPPRLGRYERLPMKKYAIMTLIQLLLLLPSAALAVSDACAFVCALLFSLLCFSGPGRATNARLSTWVQLDEG